jgi:hypothetical protein
MEPPYIAAKYKDASILTPVAGGSPKVRGKRMAIAIVAESPGMAPTNRPIAVPPIIARILIKVNTLVKPSKIFSITSASSQENGPSGIGKFKNCTNSR